MGALLKIENYSPSIVVEKSYLDQDADAGTGLLVKSAGNMATDQYALIGALAQEQTELCKITGITANTLTVSPVTSYDHAKYTDVTVLLTNKLRIYHATNIDGSAPADGSFTLLATVDVDVDNIETTYNDTSGGSDYWYKFTYYNSTTLFETDIADSVAVRGGETHYATIAGIRQQAGMNNNRYIADSLISEKRAQAEDIVNNMMGGTYDIPFDDPAPPQITHIVELLAAGYLLSIDYGPFASGTSKDGKAKIDEAMDALTKLKTHASELLDATGLSIVTGSRPHGWPNDDTELTRTESDGSTRKFRMEDKY